MDLLKRRQDSTVCRKIAVDLVGVGELGKRKKEKGSIRIMSTGNHTEVAPKCLGFRKKLKKGIHFLSMIYIFTWAEVTGISTGL